MTTFFKLKKNIKKMPIQDRYKSHLLILLLDGYMCNKYKRREVMLERVNQTPKALVQCGLI